MELPKDEESCRYFNLLQLSITVTLEITVKTPTALFILFCSQIKVSVFETVKKLLWGLLVVI